ncbi:phage tail protein [Roseateles sp. SL47]|uniref:phage tail-collar fiber domain-containing protein n=1 Tax=Roseateles sp. SL47 TaxID=2995138 RepID=UPI00227013CA|nr:phage tail protein [Roseateles sp. SL47]WAC70800.1 phage tail protein [Roseateles sp. SL47]
MTSLVTTTLEAGLAAILRKTGDGLSAQITHVALGDAAYTPSQAQTSLRNERARFPVSDGKVQGARQLHIAAIADGDSEFWVREVGFVLSDGTFLAIWSDPARPLAYKAPSVDLLLGFDLALSGVPAGSVTIESTGDLNLSLAEEFAAMAKAIVDLQRLQLHPYLHGAKT